MQSKTVDARTTDHRERERRELLIDTFASWALEGMQPTSEDIRLARQYINGGITTEEIITDTIAKYRCN